MLGKMQLPRLDPGARPGQPTPEDLRIRETEGMSGMSFEGRAEGLREGFLRSLFTDASKGWTLENK